MRRGRSFRPRAAELAALCVVSGLACSSPRRAPLVFSVFDAPDEPGPRAAPLPPTSLSLALAGLPAEALPRIRGALAGATDEAVRRAVPLFVDLGGTAPARSASPLKDVLRTELPAATAAENLSRSSWTAAGLRVQLGPACVSGATQCVPMFAPWPNDPVATRARAVAWGWSHAALLRAHGPSADLARALGQKRQSSDSTLALVFSASSGTLDERELKALEHQAQRALAHAPERSPERYWLEALANAPERWSLPIALERDEVLVVPRLSALARMDAFTAEVASCGSFDWMVRP